MTINIPLSVTLVMPDAFFRFRGSDTADFTKLEWLDIRPRPTAQQLMDAWAAYEQDLADRQALKSAIRAELGGLVGTHVNDITAGQALLIIKILLWQFGSLDGSGNIKPVGQWEID